MAMVVAGGGCFVELGLGVTGAVGPRVDNDRPNVYFVIGSGFQLDDGGPYRFAVATTLQGAHVDYDEGFSSALGGGVSLGYDQCVRTLGPTTQLRASARATIWSFATSMSAPGPEAFAHDARIHDGFLGVTLGVACHESRGCGQVSLGVPLTYVSSDETRWALVTGAEIRISAGQSIWERLDKNTSSDLTGR
ncbi:MAG: hypothetical protein K8M05_23185 [Deltaproteobacteria bacterium]|nr:hypothetical protein [Kofleriaceae bacterium]